MALLPAAPAAAGPQVGAAPDLAGAHRAHDAGAHDRPLHPVLGGVSEGHAHAVAPVRAGDDRGLRVPASGAQSPAQHGERAARHAADGGAGDAALERDPGAAASAVGGKQTHAVAPGVDEPARLTRAVGSPQARCSCRTPRARSAGRCP